MIIDFVPQQYKFGIVVVVITVESLTCITLDYVMLLVLSALTHEVVFGLST